MNHYLNLPYFLYAFARQTSYSADSPSKDMLYYLIGYVEGSIFSVM